MERWSLIYWTTRSGGLEYHRWLSPGAARILSKKKRGVEDGFWAGQWVCIFFHALVKVWKTMRSYCMDFNQHPCFCPLFSVACNKTLFQTFCLHFNIDTTTFTDINFHELCPQWQQMLHSCSNSPEPKNTWEHVHLCTLTSDSEYFWLKLLLKSLIFLLLL